MKRGGVRRAFRLATKALQRHDSSSTYLYQLFYFLLRLGHNEINIVRIQDGLARVLDLFKEGIVGVLVRLEQLQRAGVVVVAADVARAYGILFVTPAL
jgi:hypothetical protein